ncbi:hypothetical protein BC833DRAFT_622157 [Globomyces pollinis-pini]|nr:hypothetical protein BC833DRAFT_622157 [Globomyces pollinis-pini]
MYISGWIYYSLLGIETLATIAYTYNQIHSFLHKKPSLYQMIAIVVIVLVLHAGLYGGLYFLVCFPDGSVCYPWKSFVKTWIRYRSYWFVLVFILNFLPVQIIAFIVVSNLSTNDTNVFKTVLKMFSLDRSFTALTIVQVIIIILYFMVNYVQLQTTLCGDDMTYLLFGHLRTTLVGFHEILNIWLTSRIRVLFQGAANSGRESQTSQIKTVKPDKFGIEKSHPSVTTGL